MSSRILVGVLLASLCALPARAGEAQPVDVPQTSMPDKVYKLFRQAIDSYPFPENTKADQLKENHAALELLKTMPWPDLSKMERVRLVDAKDPKQFAFAWRLKGPHKDLILVRHDLTARRMPTSAFGKVEVVDHADEVAALLRYLKNRDPDPFRRFDFTFFSGFEEGMPFHAGVFLLHHAYAAAALGHPENAKLLLHEAIRQRRQALSYTYEEGAWQSFYRGIVMLEKYAPRSEVLAQWTATLKTYGKSSYQAQLLDLTEQLKKQLDEDRQLAAATVKEPDKLPLKERIAYYIARFPDVHGEQFSSPGHCRTVDMGEGTKYSDAIVKIGRPAVPALIEHLTDTRLTRSIGFQRNFYPQRIVLRAQDVAVQCIEMIVKLRFYHPTSTSSYLSNEAPEVRSRVIADIKKWWKENGHKSEIEGYLARLEAVHLYERLELLDRIEGMDKKAIDAVATLKRWALMVDPHQVPTVAQALVRRGDRTLVPAVRQMMRDGGGGAAEVIWFMIRHGNAEDFRFLRLALQHDLANGAPLGSSRVYGPASSGLRDSTSPLAVPLLVDLLGQRQITGSRWVSEIKASRGFSCADSSIEALIRLTGHNEGYQSGDDDQQRFTAIDRWQAWWQSEGRAAYVKKHPEVLRVLEGDERPVGDLGTRKLPPLVRVTASDLKSPLSYDVPRADVAALLKTGAIEGRESPKGEVSFRFTSPQAAEKWFAAARVVPAAKKAAPKAVFTRLCREDFRGPAFAPDGRAWFWLAESDIPTVTAKKQVEAAFRGKEPYISGVETLLVDRSGRVWLIPYAQRQVLLGYDPATKEWTERRCTPESLGKKPANAREAQMTSPLFEDRAGRLYFPDHLGVHVLDGKTWSYQPLFARNIKEQRYESDWRSFNEPQFVQDTEGRVYAWSLWASRGWTGTIGYWVFDGRKWTNDAGVEHLRHVLPRTRDEVWLITEKQQFAVQRGGKLLTGEEAQKALFPHLRFESLWCVGTGADGTACLQLLNVTENTTFIRSTTRSVLVPPSGAARDLGQNGRTFFDGCTQGDVAFGPNGWLWTGAGGKVRRLSPDGKDLLVLEGPRRFSEPQLRAVDGKGQLYVTGSGHVWRCLPHEAQTVQETGEPLFPAMRARCLERVCQDSQGRLWCTWDIPDPPGAVFTGTTWRTFGGRRDLGPHGFSSAFPGAGGTLVLQEPYAFRLFDAKGMVEARSLPDLLKQHGERVAACLTCPPQPSIPAYSHLIKDGKGRFWWANWEHDWGVVDGGKLIDGKAAKLGIGPKSGGRRFVILTPIGAGGRVLAVDDSGATAILDVMDGHLVKLADAPKTHFDDHHYRRQRPLHDGAGRVWLVGYIGGSVAIDADGKIAARHAGKLLLEDSRRGLWFQVASNRTTSLVRLDPAGRELRLAVPDLLESAPLAEAPDGTLWTLTTSHLVRLRAEAERLKVVERYPLRVSARDTLWCDGLGRVWHLHEPWSSGRQERHLICYATLLP